MISSCRPANHWKRVAKKQYLCVKLPFRCKIGQGRLILKACYVKKWVFCVRIKISDLGHFFGDQMFINNQSWTLNVQGKTLAWKSNMLWVCYLGIVIYCTLSVDKVRKRKLVWDLCLSVIMTVFLMMEDLTIMQIVEDFLADEYGCLLFLKLF